MRVRADTNGRSGTWPAGHDQRLVPLDPQPPHDLQQARMVRERKRLCRPRDLPIMLLERGEHDSLFSFGPQSLKRRVARPRIVARHAAHGRRQIGRADRLPLRRHDRALDRISQLANVVALPVICNERFACLRRQTLREDPELPARRLDEPFRERFGNPDGCAPSRR